MATVLLSPDPEDVPFELEDSGLVSVLPSPFVPPASSEEGAGEEAPLDMSGEESNDGVDADGGGAAVGGSGTANVCITYAVFSCEGLVFEVCV